MKIQGLAIIFVVIIVPIYFTLSVYIQGQIDVIVQTTAYDTKLQGATYDALKAFQINTVNNNFSSVSDSKIRDIEASTSTFFTSLATNMGSTGISQGNLDVYVPLLVYTLYDGYYIYSRYDNAVTPEVKYEMGLKPYIYYTERYRTTDGMYDFVVNYTLDNYITIIGKVNNLDVMKSGYLLDPSQVSNRTESSVKYKETTIGPEFLSEELVILDDDNNPEAGTTQTNTYSFLYYNQQKIYKEKNTNEYFYYTNYQKQVVNDKDIKAFCLSRTTPYGLMDTSAIEYYNEAYEFSTWVNNEIGNRITDRNAEDHEALEYVSGSAIFNLSSTNDPELKSSQFNAHRAEVIKHSIITNLSSAIAAYNRQSGYLVTEYQFALPKMKEEQWDMIENNITIISFMQGLPMGGFKYYNGYTVLSNDKNKEVVKDDSIYIVAEHAGEFEYHLPNCRALNDGLRAAGTNTYNAIKAYSNTSFVRKSINANSNTKYYVYPQKCPDSTGVKRPITQCYDCLVNSGKTYDLDEVKNGSPNISVVTRLYYHTAIAREKQVLYKTGDYIRKITIQI